MVMTSADRQPPSPIVSAASGEVGPPRSPHRSCRGAASFNATSRTLGELPRWFRPPATGAADRQRRPSPTEQPPCWRSSGLVPSCGRSSSSAHARSAATIVEPACSTRSGGRGAPTGLVMSRARCRALWGCPTWRETKSDTRAAAEPAGAPDQDGSRAARARRRGRASRQLVARR